MTFPANYAVIAEDELTYVTGGGTIANVLPAVMTSENWRTFSTNLVKIVGNTFMARFLGTFLGSVFTTNFGGLDDVVSAMQTNFGAQDLGNGILQFLGGVAAVYTLGTNDAKVLPADKILGVDGKVVPAAA